MQLRSNAHQLLTACNHGLLFLLFLVFPTLFYPQVSALAEEQASLQKAIPSGRVAAVPAKGFGRLVFRLNRIPQYSYDLAGTILVIKFEEPVNIRGIGLIPESLYQYVSIARRDPDGRGVRLALTNSFRVKLTDTTKRLYIDIMPMDWAGMPPRLPDQNKGYLQKLWSAVTNFLRGANI